MNDVGGDVGELFGAAALTGGQVVCVLGPCLVGRATPEGMVVEDEGLSAIQSTILARLALARNGAVGVDELAEAIWGDSPPATARTSIHNQISRIRAKLGPSQVVTESGSYRLNAVTDAGLVADTLSSVEALLADERFPEATLLAESVLRLWHGVPFHELGELDEAHQERVLLAEVHRSLETMRLEAAVRSGRFGWAVPEAERLVDEAPDDEHRWELLVRSLGAAGRRGDALGAYERARRALVDQLGLEPGRQLRMAEAAILDGGDEARPQMGAGPLVGKTDLVAEALARFAIGQHVLLVGEIGIGKTRVLQELCRRFRRKDITVATATCSLHPDSAVATLAELAASLGAVLDQDLPPVAAFAAAVRGSVADGAQVILVVDDIDLAGPTSVHALGEAAGIDGVMLVATATEVDLLPVGLLDAALPVGPLSDGEVAELFSARVDEDHQVDASEVVRLIQMSGGNPAILEHLLDDPLWCYRSQHGLRESNEPLTPSEALRDVVRNRVNRLGKITRSTLEVAAVLGPNCPADLLVALVPEVGVAGAVGAALLTEESAEDGRKWLTFRHGAIQQILYDDLSPGRRMEIHHRAASLLRTSGASAASIAHHALASAEVDTISAVSDAFSAAQGASGHGAHGDAAQWYERALDVIDRTGVCDRLRVEAMVGMGDSLRLAGSPQQETVLLDAADAAFELGDGDLLGDAVFAVLQLGVTTESGKLHERAIDLAERALVNLKEPDQRALIAGGASLAYSMTGDPELCRKLFIMAEADAQSDATRRCVLPFAYLALGHPRDLEQREQITNELFDRSMAESDPIASFEALQLAFSVALQRCDGDRARQVIEESARLIDRLGDVGRRWSLAYQQAAVAHIDGDLKLAESLAESAFELFVPVSPSRAMAAYGAQLLVIRLAQGRLDELIETIEGLVADQPGVPAWNAALALAVSPTDPDRAQSHAAAALDGVAEDFTWLAAHVIGGRAAAAAGDDETRMRYLERLTPYSGQGCWQGTCSYGPVDTVLTLLYSALGDLDLAEEHRSLAIAGARALGSPVFEAEVAQIDL